METDPQGGSEGAMRAGVGGVLYLVVSGSILGVRRE